MALVTYSDSEASDSGSIPNAVSVPSRKAPVTSTTKETPFQPLVDRSNPRKILVNLPDAKGASDGLEDTPTEDGPARKRARIGGGGSFAGFNAMLPAPKRVTQAKGDKKATSTTTSQRVFSLKTSATPGFSREPNSDFLENNDEAAEDTSGHMGGNSSEPLPAKKEEAVVEKKGNAMMFKPLSVARNTKKRPKAPPQKATTRQTDEKGPQIGEGLTSRAVAQTEQQKPKPKINLFGLSGADSDAQTTEPQPQNTQYKPLIYAPSSESTPLQLQQESTTEAVIRQEETTSIPAQPNSLENIANDLNLSQSEMRQLMGRKGRGLPTANAKILTFNTDEEYKSNSAYLAAVSEQELAAQQHNPVRAIAPGKHNLQQLVNAVSNQREALEESFVAGKRNRKEAGSRYGW
ncbi:hypothetical protein PRK78_002547 [Emydomyces testavorans]|uniref:Mitotic checkpoint regulator, MAD2B-interacting-domain-containing protein n=1 Tax=Emydomyces testavorans TaxID=2070801 RepID=A0AAF0IHN9_9EURO|nr:hypothetical protein PRK78_002547 [Emydomyces testavorans]